MPKRILLAAGLTMLAAAVTISAQEDKAKKEDGTEKALANIVLLGPGVHNVKTDDKGRIQRCVVVGQSRISTVLGVSQGLQDARTKARLSCEGEFVKWLKTKVDVHIKNEKENILFQEGNEGNDKDALQESGKSVDKLSQQFQSTARGLVRGLQVLGSDIDGKNKTLTLVMGWDAQTAAAVQKIEAKEGTKAKDQPQVKDVETKAAPPKESPNKKIGDKRIASPNLKKFLD